MEVTQDMPLVLNGRRALASVRREWLSVAAAVTILVLALGLRLYGLGWDEGFDWTPHPDERAILSKVNELSPPAPGDLGSLLDAEESTWNPQWFPYGSFPLYLLKGIQLTYSALPGLEMEDLRQAGRTVSALADVATVGVVLLLGTRLYGRRAGILAGGFTALAVLHIQLSHFYAVDTLLALFTVAAFYFMFRVAKEGKPRDSVLAGAFIGLGLATKVSQAPILIPYVGAHLMYAVAMSGREEDHDRAFPERWPRALTGLGAGAATLLTVGFVVQPYAFLDHERFLADFTEQSEMVRRIRDYPYTRQYADTAPYWYQARQLATWGLGLPLGLVAWGGLLFVSVRGMRLPFGLTYVVAGWGVPMALLLLSNDVKVILLASGVAFAALLATLPLRSARTRTDVLLLSWVVPYLLIIGSLEVKFLRYMVPVTPFLILFGSAMIVSAWDVAKEKLPPARHLVLVALAVVVGATGFYALSYLSIYGEPHTAVRASEWINRNAPKGSVVLKEHWEEGLPGLYGYNVLELPMYEPDRVVKFERIAGELADADYLVFFSNRLYGTLPRLPERYPLSTGYYDLLFTGQLGYELVDYQRSYPSLLGISFVDDTFRRPGVPEPEPLAGNSPSAFNIGMGFADESFTVYDHPKVLIFENQGLFEASEILDRLYGVGDQPAGITGSGRTSREIGLLMSLENAETQRAGGTWTEIVDADSWTNRLPLLAWLIVIEGIALLALPIGFVVFRPLPDRGFLFTKVLGLLIVGLAVWLLASFHWMAFSRGAIGVALVGLTAVSVALLVRRREEMIEFVRRRWALLVIGEVLFLAAFLAFVALRMANPDLWHPFRGGEKPMDFAYLNAVLRSTYMPPYDPWFAGGYINYYYWGQFIVATLVRATGIDPAVAFNLAVPTFFALTFSSAFGLVYNLAALTRRRRPDTAAGGMRWSPVVAGVTGGVFVTVLGNLEGAVQVGHGAWRALALNKPFGQFDFWASSRVMPPDPPGFEINEFPFFTFLFADLHAHLVALPFTLLVLGLGLAVLMGAIGKRRPGARDASDSGWDGDEMARLAVLGLAVGSLRVINTWDYPTYLGISTVAVLLAGYFRHGGLSLSGVAESAAKALLVAAVGWLAFQPFLRSYETFFTSVETTTNQTVLWQFLVIHGLFVFIIGSYLLRELWTWLRPVVARGISVSPTVADAETETGSAHPTLRTARIAAIAAGVAGLGYVVATAAAAPAGSTVPFVSLILLLLVPVMLRSLHSWTDDSPVLVYVVVMIGVAFAIVFGLDLWRVEGDIDRMNSVFKFYLQVWVLLAVASAYLLWRMLDGRRPGLAGMSSMKWAWAGALAVLFVSASVYPVLGTRDRLRDRFNDNPTPLTLDGEAFIQEAVYRDQLGFIDLAADFEGIEWLRANVQGSPVVLEGHTPTYRWGGRVSIYTGLPSVVGWQWHQEQQRWDYGWAVGDRISDVNRIYETVDAGEAALLLREYDVRYVYLGELERLYYPADGLAKFDGEMSRYLTPIVVNDAVTIYRVVDDS